MLGLRHLIGTVDLQSFTMPVEIGHGHKQIERLACRQQPRTHGARIHRLARIEQQPGELMAAKGRRKPACAHEAGQLARYLLARFGRHRLLDRHGFLAQQRPGDGFRPNLAEPVYGPCILGQQLVDIRHFQPHVGQRIERAPGDDGLGKENAVDAARAGAGHNIADHPQPQLSLVFYPVQQIEIHLLGARGLLLAIGMGAAGAQQPPDLFQRAMHVDRQADSAIADHGQPKFLFPHGHGLGKGGGRGKRAGRGVRIARR